MSGWGKAIWILFLVFIPFLTGLVYLIARGSGMRDRAIKAQTDAKAHFDEYVREQAATSPAEELHKLNDLREKGALTTEEFDATLATFNGHPHYEIMRTGQIYDGDDEVMGYYLSTCWERISESSTACRPRATRFECR